MDGEGTSATSFLTGGGRGVALIIPLGGDGPCAFLLARLPPPRGKLRDQNVALVLAVLACYLWRRARAPLSRW
jgi:hypothetical protein